MIRELAAPKFELKEARHPNNHDGKQKAFGVKYNGFYTGLVWTGQHDKQVWYATRPGKKYASSRVFPTKQQAIDYLIENSRGANASVEVSFPDYNTYTRGKAKKLDKSYYADTDDEGTWGVYGDVSGFCYATPAGGRVGAEHMADQMNKLREKSS